MTRVEIKTMLDAVRIAYRDALDGKTVSFTGVNGRTLTNHDPKALREEMIYWEDQYAKAGRRGGPYKLANFL